MNYDSEQRHAGAPAAATAHDVTVEPGQSSRSTLLRKPDHAVASGLVQRKARDANGIADGADHAVSAASSSTSSLLPDPLMRKFESSLGADLSGVRIHTGSASEQAADAVGAKAYTIGNDIHFGAGHYDPSSSAGQHLLAHEVAHTVQQSDGAQRMQCKLQVSSPGDSLEHEADRAADAMVSGGAATDVALAPSKRTLTQGLHSPAVQRSTSTVPAPTEIFATSPSAHSPDQPLALHLLEPDALQPLRLDPFGLQMPSPLELRSKLFPGEHYLDRQVGADFALLGRNLYAVRSADDYVARVKQIFGSLEAYLRWIPVSDEILTRPVVPQSKRLVRDLVEHKGEEQRVFFRWVSWAYQQRGFGPDAIVDIIAKGRDPAMSGALSGAEREIGARIQAEGFNPRPMKDSDQRYLLGTLSEHATGTAIDIAPRTNPILAIETWRAIQAASFFVVDRSLERWIHDPLGLFIDVAAIDRRWASAAQAALDWQRSAQLALEQHRAEASDRFAHNHPGLLNGAEQRTAKSGDRFARSHPGLLDGDEQRTAKSGDRFARSHPSLFTDDEQRSTQIGDHFVRSHAGLLTGGEGVSPHGSTSALGVCEPAPKILSESELRVAAVKSLLGRATGEAAELAALPEFHFLGHDCGLVLALRAQGLVWGITFRSSVDLHHFEIRNPPLPPWSPGRR